MASFLRGKQTGMQKDLSASIQPQAFAPGEQARYGINSQISCFAYDPIQSLLAIGTSDSKYGTGQIYIFGQARIQKIISPSSSTFSTSSSSSRRAASSSIKYLRFVAANRILSIDSKSELALWDLSVTPTPSRIGHPLMIPGAVVAVVTDPLLDWVLLALSSGEVVAYDLDRERLCATFQIPNFWRTRDPRAKLVNVVSMQLHPRDIGQLLIGYTHGAVVYSFKQNKAIKWFEYVLPPGAPGGNGEGVDVVRRPRLTQAVWHPTGTFVLTAHEDGSLVFWDPKLGAERVICARSIYDAGGLDQPRGIPMEPRVMQPFVKVAWCCKEENADDTALLIAGGQSMEDPEKGLQFLELGPTPVYATSSWQVLADYFKGTKAPHLLHTPSGADVVDFQLLPRFSPYYDGAQDPLAIMAELSSGELLALSFPSGFPISPTNQLHPSLSFLSPFVHRVAVSTLDRERWLGMTEKRNTGELLLKGGAEMPKPRRRYEGRNVIQVAHVDSTVRLWDLGHADDMENPAQLQVDVARAVGRWDNVEISAMHMASNTGEFAAGTKMGEVVIYRWGGNKNYGREAQQEIASNPGGLTDISSRAEPSLKDGLQPFVLYEMMQGPISALCVSDVGFVAVGSAGGFFSIIDLRGPTVAFQTSVGDFTKQEKRSSFLRGGSHAGGSGGAASDYATAISFGIMTLEGDTYSSIACFVGTAQGKVATFKLLPSGAGYDVKLAGVVQMNDKLIALSPIVAETGQTAAATGQVAASLRQGAHVSGVLVAVSQTEIRVFKPATARGASKTFEDVFCDAAAVSEYELHGFALVAAFGDGTTRAFTLPGLKEIARSSLPELDPTRYSATIVASTGDVIGWAGPSELVVIPVWGTGKGKGHTNNDDRLINPEAILPPRPTISGVQWITGTQYVSPTDLDLLIGGPDRPPSKRMIEASAQEARLARSAANANAVGSSNNPRAGTSQEGWGEYLQRQVQERTEKLNLMGDNMAELNQNSAGWADDVNKFIGKQKRNVVMGAFKSKFF